MDSFKKEFDKLQELGEGTFVLRGSTIVVEILDDEELKTKGGIIIATDSRQVKGNSIEQNKLQVGRILMVGQGYWNDETQTREALEATPGAVVILPQYGSQVISMFPGIQRPTGSKLCLIKMDQVLAYYPSAEAYERAKSSLN